jgi:hypothetical protein
LEAPSIAAVVATPSAAVAEAPAKSAEAAASPAAVLGAAVSTAALVAARPTAADGVALTTTPAAGRLLSPSRSGSSSSAFDMSGAEDGVSGKDGFHKPRRRRKKESVWSPGPSIRLVLHLHLPIPIPIAYQFLFACNFRPIAHKINMLPRTYVHLYFLLNNKYAVDAKIATVLGSIPASAGTVESEGRQMKKPRKRNIQKVPLFK